MKSKWSATKMSKVKELTKLSVQPSAETLGYYRVKRDWKVEVSGRSYLVPAGFNFDGDSVPRWPIIYWIAKGRSGLKAPCIHDWLYITQPVSRRQADQAYLFMMQHSGVEKRWQIIHYLGVRIGGWVGWRQNAKRKENRRKNEAQR